ncbi:MAG TPA: universal stress protein, partial [Actinospica sp.]|nr:universal stress protein [Actinospica sp.]
MTNGIGRVFAGVDGTPGSLQALRHALDLARVFAAPLIPVLAWQPPGGEGQARVHEVPELAQEW